MIRLWILALQLSELFVSSVVHLLYGFYIFSSAVAGDLSQALNEIFFKPKMNVEVKEVVPKETTTNVDDLPPIVLVHGIFGFGKGVRLFSPIFLSNGFRYLLLSLIVLGVLIVPTSFLSNGF